MATRVAAQVPEARPVQIAAIRWIIDSVVVNLRPLPTAACLASATLRSIGGHPAPMLTEADLDATTIRSIPKLQVPLLPRSACYLGGESGAPTLDSRTGRQAVAIQVGPVQLDNEMQAAIQIEYRMNGRWGAGYRCRVVRQDGSWQILTCARTWIS
ncbi:MAG: hypothetical protein HYV19_05605 [Gemmatimonadetes bacterium]|nr:hypothetical protein [Gemmatimonadota bacterium]